MKETKVYVDELPESCSKCLFCYDNRPYWKSTDCIINHKELDEDEIEIKREKDCSLVDIKDHDRELVKEVCEKIKLKFSDTRSHNWGVERIELYEFLDQIQKEAENGQI